MSGEKIRKTGIANRWMALTVHDKYNSPQEFHSYRDGRGWHAALEDGGCGLLGNILGLGSQVLRHVDPRREAFRQLQFLQVAGGRRTLLVDHRLCDVGDTLDARKHVLDLLVNLKDNTSNPFKSPVCMKGSQTRFIYIFACLCI